MSATSLQAVCTAVKSLLVEVSGIGKVEERPGGVATWVKSPNALQAFWQIDVPAREEEPKTLGPKAEQVYVIRIEGFMPWTYENPNSASVWRALVDAVCDQLRVNATLGGIVMRCDNPSLKRNDRVPFQDGEKEVLCHYALIEVRAYTRLAYTPR